MAKGWTAMNLRRRIWIDRFQTLLSLRIALYFAFYQISIWSLVALERASSSALAPILGPAANTSFLFLIGGTELFLTFLFIYDAVKTSHRLVGPLYRIRKAVNAI